MSKLKICEDCLYKIFRYVSKNDRGWYDSCECSEEECQGVDGSDAEIVVGMNKRIADLEAQIAHKERVIEVLAEKVYNTIESMNRMIKLQDKIVYISEPKPPKVWKQWAEAKAKEQ